MIVLVFLVRGCASSSKHSSFADYMDRVRTIAASSTQLGRQLNTTLTATGIKESKLESSIRGYAAQEQQLADQAAAITPPGPLHTEHDHLIEALQLRASALSRLADAFAQTATSNNATQAGTLLSEQTRLLVASDVNWDFYFKDASKRVLQNENVTGVSVPDSTVVPNPDLASTLEQIAKGGADAFYKGEIAKRIVSDLHAKGNPMKLSDLSRYYAAERAPITSSYRGYTFFSSAPPVSCLLCPWYNSAGMELQTL